MKHTIAVLNMAASIMFAPVVNHVVFLASKTSRSRSGSILISKSVNTFFVGVLN